MNSIRTSVQSSPQERWMGGGGETLHTKTQGETGEKKEIAGFRSPMVINRGSKISNHGERKREDGGSIVLIKWIRGEKELGAWGGG